VRPIATNAVRRDRVLLVVLLACIAGVLPSAWSPIVDLKDGLQIDSVETGWSSVSRDKVVPALALKLRNVSDQKLVVLQLILRFRDVDDVHEWGYAYLTVTGSAGLAPDAVTNVFLHAPYGYVGAGADRLVANYTEAKVELFAKYASTRWTPMGEYHIARELINHRR